MIKSVAVLKSVWAPAAAFLAGVPLAVTGYSLGRMQASKPPASEPVSVASAPEAPAPAPLPADVPPEAFIQLGIKPTGKARPSTVGRAPEPPKGAVVSDPRPVGPRNPWGEPTVYAPAWHGPRDGYYGYYPRYPYAQDPGYCAPVYPRRQEPLLPFSGSSRSEREGRSQQTGRFTTR